MRIEQLQYLVEINNCKSISLAAENLYTTQPNISKGLKALEDELGLTLILRKKNNIIFTPEGNKILEYAKNALREIYQMQNFSLLHQDSQHELEGILKIIYPAQIKYVLANVLSTFHDSYPKVTLDITEQDSLSILEGLSGREADIYFLNFVQLDTEAIAWAHRLLDKTYTLNLLYNEKLYLSLAPDHPLSGRQSISLKELSSVPLGVIKGENNDLDYLNKLLIEKYNCRFCIFTNDSEILHQKVQSGYCGAITCKSISLNRHKDNCQIIPIESNIVKSVYLASSNAPERTPLVEAFRKILHLEIAHNKLLCADND